MDETEGPSESPAEPQGKAEDVPLSPPTLPGEHAENSEAPTLRLVPAVRAKVIGRPFPRGVSGNPGGRPKSKPIRDALLKLGGLTVAELERLDPTRLTTIERAAYCELQRMLITGPNMVAHAAFQEVADRVDGKVAQKIYASQGVSEELDNLSDDELQERVKDLREKNR